MLSIFMLRKEKGYKLLTTYGVFRGVVLQSEKNIEEAEREVLVEEYFKQNYGKLWICYNEVIT